MPSHIDIETAEFLVETKASAGQFRLTWPTDKYYDLVRGPVQVVQMEASALARVARSNAPEFPDAGRLEPLIRWFEEAAAGSRVDWPALPVLTRTEDDLAFIDGRHRCEALHVLGATHLPVIVG